MLARLDRIGGVERSFTNRSGTLLRLALLPGTDAEQVARETARVLGAAVEDRTPVRLAGEQVTEALREQEWRDASRVAELSMIEMQRLLLRALLTLVLGGAAVGLAIFWWRRRRARAGK